MVLPQLECECNAEAYAVIILCFVAVFSIFRMYAYVQPDFEGEVDRHALQLNFINGYLWAVMHGIMTFFLLVFGVGIKLLIEHPTDEQFIRPYAWLVCVGFTISIVFMDITRLTHAWFAHGLDLFGTRSGDRVGEGGCGDWVWRLG